MITLDEGPVGFGVIILRVDCHPWTELATWTWDLVLSVREEGI